MKTSKVTLFYNTPLTTFNDTIHFDSDNERDEYFLGETDRFNRVSLAGDYNFIRDNLTLRISEIPYERTNGINYGTILDGTTGQRYYFFVLGIRYTGTKVVLYDIVIDVLMTYTQGAVLTDLRNVMVHRQHLPTNIYNQYLKKLQTNDDILPATTKRYKFNKSKLFKDLTVIFQCSVDLESSFGKVEKPLMKLPRGVRYDKLVSPVGLFACSPDSFSILSRDLQDYPWIGQNISKILLVPSDIVDSGDLEAMKLNGKEQSDIKKFKNGGTSSNREFTDFTFSTNQICQALNIPEEELHLLRSGYTTCEVYTWNGESLELDLAEMDTSLGLKFMLYTSIGYQNEMKIFPLRWNSLSDTDEGAVLRGSFLNNSISFSNFTELPMLIDNYKASLASNANQRALDNRQTTSGRVKSISSSLSDPNMNPLEKASNIFTDAYSLMGGGFSLSTIGSKIASDTEYYRRQRAQFADMAISAPTVTSSTGGQAFQIANDIFGFTVKMSSPTQNEIDRIRKYYSSMGFGLEEMMSVYDVHSMTVCNFLQVEGSFKLDRVPTQFMEQIRALLLVGVRFWHNDGTTNPLKQNLLQNKRRI